MADLRSGPVSVSTKIGALRVEFTSRGVCRLEFRSSKLPAATGKVAQQLKAYASGKRIRFTIPLDLTAGTAFQRSVWRALRKIPSGQTRSYAWVARQISRPRATRAVGAACGANPIPIIVPCHRVIASDGSLGGFSGGLALKRRLLKLEHAL